MAGRLGVVIKQREIDTNVPRRRLRAGLSQQGRDREVATEVRAYRVANLIQLLQDLQRRADHPARRVDRPLNRVCPFTAPLRIIGA